jgi:NADPH2:quinone reductase
MKFKPQVIADSLRELFAWFEAGHLHPHISNVLPLEQAGDGIELLRARKSTGKVVIEVAAE